MMPTRYARFLDLHTSLPFLAGNTWWKQFLTRALNHILRLTVVRQAFLRATEQPHNQQLMHLLCKEFFVDFDASGVLEKIPASGAAIIAANHPYGGADAVALTALCLQKRPNDFLIFANEIVNEAPCFEGRILPLWLDESPESARKNLASLRRALEHLRAGGLLAIFPSGEVSTWQDAAGEITDRPWTTHAATLARKTHAPLIPIRFFGHNRWYFHLLGRIHPFLRTALIARACEDLRGKKLSCRAGKPILAGTNDRATTAQLRRVLYQLELP